ncbi:hypothetical protein Pfo_025455, partial [Paulownia fortunei]
MVTLSTESVSEASDDSLHIDGAMSTYIRLVYLKSIGIEPGKVSRLAAWKLCFHTFVNAGKACVFSFQTFWCCFSLCLICPQMDQPPLCSAPMF